MEDVGRQRQPRGVDLTPAQRDGLERLLGTAAGVRLLKSHLGGRESTFRKYVQGKGRRFPRLKLPELEALIRTGQGSPPGGTADPHGPEGRFQGLFAAASAAHYDRFDAVAAAGHLVRLLGREWPAQVGAELLLDRLVVALAMLRQSACAGPALFTVAADLCLARLDHLGPDDKGDRLAALACCVAWELAAVVAQRGAAAAAEPLLDRVAVTIGRFTLAQALPPGRDWTMAKMRQWAGEVAGPGPGGAGGRLEAPPAVVLVRPTEAFNAVHQRLCALARRALADPGAREELCDFFDAAYRRAFVDMTDQVHHAGIANLGRIVTPSTAGSAVLQVTLIAGLVGCEGAGDLPERARLLHDAVEATARGGVVLHRSNPETAAGVVRLRSGRWRSVAPAFDLTPDLSPGLAADLLGRAGQVLDAVEGCLTRAVAVP